MDAPKCRICGEREFNHVCSGAEIAEATAASTRKPAGLKKKSKPGVEGVSLSELVARVESLEARVGELESRKKYMRDYQRARRAEEKLDG